MRFNFSRLNILQKVSMTFMAVMVVLTFVGANLHALLWQSSEWLVSTVLPAVVVELTNEERTSNSVLPLQRNTTLDQAAKLKAEHMAKNEYFSHFSPDGVSPWHWFKEAGYVYAHAGENLAIHFTDSTEVVDAWMDSPTHRKNIVNNLYTEIGVGTAKGKFDGYNTVYVVQLFGTPAIPSTISQTSEALVVPAEQVAAPEPEIISKAIPTEVAERASVDEVEGDKVFAIAEIETVSEVVSPALVSQPTKKSETVEHSLAAAETVSTPYDESVNTAKNLLNNSELEVSTETNSVVITSPVFATSSGLAIAQLETDIQVPDSGNRLISIATQPNTLLQVIYTLLALAVMIMLITSIIQGARKFNYYQVTYGCLLLVGMGSLWFVHSLLTTGAVVT